MGKFAFAVDGNSYVHAQYAGTKGHGCAAEYMVRMIEHYLQKYANAEAIVFFDPPGPTWRHAIYPEYKAGRDAKDPGLLSVLDKAQELAAHRRLLGPVHPGYESDDMLAIYATNKLAAGYNVTVCSRDKDMRQLLVPGRCNILKEFKTFHGQPTSVVYYNADHLRDEEQLRPDQWADFRTLTGDKSDNWPGAEGIGEVAARKILAHAGSLAEAMRQAKHSPLSLPLNPKQRDTLARFDWELGLRLMTLRRSYTPEPQA